MNKNWRLLYELYEYHAIEAAGLQPIASELAAIDAVNDRKSLEATIAKLQREGPAWFPLQLRPGYQRQHASDRDGQPGRLGCPTATIIFATMKISAIARGLPATRRKMFELAATRGSNGRRSQNGDDHRDSAGQGSRTRVELRDPRRTTT